MSDYLTFPADIVGTIALTDTGWQNVEYCHTGGGCFAIIATFEDDTYVMVTEGETGTLDVPCSGPYLVGYYNAEGDPFADDDSSYRTVPDVEGVINAIKALQAVFS